ncbi:MAG: cation:proton antiporter [Meiothermus sp.]|uniref:cation:proton antiporter n=1 Tax=Meiothermus sp. TaxID=1955249 RepID=UPI0025FA9AF8|nr:cation:proton antiporter [Meiothermus sp.]MCS7058480.1 cation:proton antiporter [Meiothermus sp.]MCS7195322.1 cation:proton antiporter [Meiothermus sp.]MCX7740520.1 cation:proton antiporter [Meiothermus sp.]MDW8091667.1 cation:proton antiporter [Meiothermus sp.]MDW8480983.1 cation:proton antiporter [Meiothermus sp.]
MENIWFSAALWLGLALFATLLSIWLGISVALTEIVVGVAAQLVVGAALGPKLLGAEQSWVVFLAGVGSIVLTFLAGAELDPEAFRKSWKEATVLGLAAFLAPFLGVAGIAHLLLGWAVQPAWLAGVALSTTSVAVVYAVMLELGLNKTAYGKLILAACFVNDLATVVALGLLFAPFGLSTLLFALGLAAGLWLLLKFTGPFFRRYGGRTSELEAKFLLFALFLLGGLATWSGSEAVLPAYLVGMVLAGTVGRDHALVRRLRTLTFGFLTPFYFIRAGSLVQIPALLSGFWVFLALLLGKMLTKFVGVYPVTARYRYPHGESMYTTLLMSTGLTFGTISALYGLSHGIITPAQYSYLVAAVIGSAVVPTWLANRFFLPKRHLEQAPTAPVEVRA